MSSTYEGVPDPEVPARARARRYSASYKARVLAEYVELDKAGKGALLRREGVYSSLISAWRELRDRGALAELAKDTRTPGRRRISTACPKRRPRTQQTPYPDASSRAGIQSVRIRLVGTRVHLGKVSTEKLIPTAAGDKLSKFRRHHLACRNIAVW